MGSCPKLAYCKLQKGISSVDGQGSLSSAVEDKKNKEMTELLAKYNVRPILPSTPPSQLYLTRQLGTTALQESTRRTQGEDAGSASRHGRQGASLLRSGEGLSHAEAHRGQGA